MLLNSALRADLSVYLRRALYFRDSVQDISVLTHPIPVLSAQQGLLEAIKIPPHHLSFFRFSVFVSFHLLFFHKLLKMACGRSSPVDHKNLVIETNQLLVTMTSDAFTLQKCDAWKRKHDLHISLFAYQIPLGVRCLVILTSGLVVLNVSRSRSWQKDAAVSPSLQKCFHVNFGFYSCYVLNQT